MSSGALNVSLRDSNGSCTQRARLMLAASAIGGLAAFIGGISGRNRMIAVAVAGVWAFAAGMLVVLGPAAADVGVMSIVMLLVFSSSPRAQAHSVTPGCWPSPAVSFKQV